MARTFCKHIFLLGIALITVSDSYARDLTQVVSLQPIETIQKELRQLDEKSMVIHYGFQKEDVQFSILAKNQATKTKSYFLIFLWSHLDEVEVCIQKETCTKAGYSHPVSAWPVMQIFPTFPLELPPNGEKEIAIRIRSKNFIESEIKLITTEELFEIINWQTGLVFSFLILILAFLFRLIYFCLLYKKRWLYFLTAFHFAIFLVFIFGSGLANYYLFPNYAIPLSLFKKVIIGILILTGCAWLSDYFQTKIRYPISHRSFQAATVLAVFLIFCSFTDTPRVLISVLYTGLYLALTILSIRLALTNLKDQLRPTPWLILSLLCLLIFEVLNIFSYETFDSHDSKIYLFFLSIFIPANAFFVSRTIRAHIYDIETELTLTKLEILKFKRDLNLSLPMANSSDRKSYLNGVNIEEVIEKLTSLMTEDKVFLEEELRLSDLAALLGLTVHQTSEILNQILKISFADLLKKYRIEEAKRLLVEDVRKPVLDVALECGFTSKSVFNEAFRKHESLTPLEFRKKQLQLYS
ncbi:helix-turn-helix domain-containing protein [Leptospira ognonensis]|uniref:Helix-turn-helix domain-containing protein n=1 Tax=Leptospira ognonensis TaxID=2484945 RepID=A0A4R9JWJ0_9LEPT|nr:helix-turn-helix domain-containing protein [Leptospira ognonensis]TGL56711.1 helix-turn-helix domain-containing protein [Leptospira ognonensis]